MAAEAGGKVLVTGAAGRLGRLLAAAWARPPGPGFAPLFAARRPAPGILGWDMAGPPPPQVLEARVLLNLAGVTAGPDLGANAALARAALEAAAAAGMAHVFLLSSAAVLGPQAPGAAPDESAAPAPVSAYGAAKAAMEAEARAFRESGAGRPPGVTILRLGNVAGADSLAAGMAAARAAGRQVLLDDFGPPGAPRGPLRSYIGPLTLARVLAALIGRALSGAALPPVLNIAAPGPLAMEALLAAAGMPWVWRPAPPGAVERVVLGTARLEALVPLRPGEADAAGMMAEVAALGGGLP